MAGRRDPVLRCGAISFMPRCAPNLGAAQFHSSCSTHALNALESRQCARPLGRVGRAKRTQVLDSYPYRVCDACAFAGAVPRRKQPALRVRLALLGWEKVRADIS